MNTFAFEFPEIMVLLIPLLYCLYRCKEKIAPRFFVHLQLFSPRKPWLKLQWLLKVLTLLALLIALASPVVIDRSNPHNRFGRDIVLCLDASGSMGASGFEEDTRRSRFEIVQEIAQGFVEKRVEDNAGIVVYGDFAFIASPVTYEKAIVSEMIGYLSQGMAGQNTAIGEAVAMGVRAFEGSKAEAKVMVLLSDGEHNSGAIAPKAAVELAKSAGIKIYTIGIGKEEEFDAALLKEIAAQSGGEFYTAANHEMLKNVYESIDALERSSLRSRHYLFNDYYYFLPLLLAFVFMTLLMRQRSAL